MFKVITWKTIIGLGVLLVLLFYCVRLNTRLFFVVTGSMKTSIPANSVVFSMKVGASEVKEGMILIFNNGDDSRITAHRMVWIQEGKYVTRGDGNEYNDRYLVRSTDILGVVVGVFPVSGPISLVSQLGFLCSVFILGVLTRRFLLCLKYGISCPVTTSGALSAICFFRYAKKTIYCWKTPIGFSKL